VLAFDYRRMSESCRQPPPRMISVCASLFADRPSAALRQLNSLADRSVPSAEPGQRPGPRLGAAPATKISRHFGAGLAAEDSTGMGTFE
jgi:hypothetical protein